MSSGYAGAAVDGRRAEVRSSLGVVVLRLDLARICAVEVEGAVADLLGFPEEDWLQDEFLSDRIDQRDREMGLRVLKDLQGASVGKVAELRLCRADAAPVWVQLCALPSACPDASEAIVTLLNIEDRVMAEAAMSRAVETMRDALVKTAQEIAQPTNAISGYGMMLERHLSAQGDDLGSEYAIGIRSAVEQMKELAESLRRVGRRSSRPG